MGQGDAWSLAQVPPQQGKTILITGANCGIGYYAAADLARAGAEVIVCARDLEKGNKALASLTATVPGGKFQLEHLDLASLASVRAFAQKIAQSVPKIDVLINNAGVMNPPTRQLTEDGFELQMGTNHLGHFALTLLLLPVLRRAPQPRVVSVSSLAAANANSQTVALCDFRKDGPYYSEAIYQESKLANQLFVTELARRVPSVTTVAAHPGVSCTDLFRYKYGLISKVLFQDPQVGALSEVRAAVDPEAKSCDYFGSKGWRGPPLVMPLLVPAQDAALAKKLWEASEKATGVTLPEP